MAHFSHSWRGVNLLVLALFFLFVPFYSQASDQPNVLILSEDGDSSSIRRDSRVTRRVLDALNGAIHDRGFNAYDETALTLNTHVQNRVRRRVAELLDVAQSVVPPVDVVVTFQTYMQTRPQASTTRIKGRVAARMIHVPSGRVLGNVEVSSPQPWNVRSGCNRQCRLESIGDHATELAAAVADALVVKMNHLFPEEGAETHPVVSGSDASSMDSNGMATPYTLTFKGFSAAEVNAFEAYLANKFSGYASHRLVRAVGKTSVIQYHSTSGTARLRRNLYKMLEMEGVAGKIQLATNRFTLLKVASGQAQEGRSFPTAASSIVTALSQSAPANRSIDLDIQFKLDSYDLEENAIIQLNQLGMALTSSPLQNIRFQIGGHTCAIGTKAHNQWLSEKRASKVIDYLNLHWGIEFSRLQSHGWGESRLKDGVNPRDGVNRRVEIRYLENQRIHLPGSKAASAPRSSRGNW